MNTSTENMVKDRFLLMAVALVFAVCFLYNFPDWVYIADEVSYINRAISLSNADITEHWTDVSSREVIPHILADYPLGTSFFLWPFYKIMGYSGLHLANLFYILASFFFMIGVIKHVDKFRILVASFIFICLPIFFFSRTIMSELPSLLIVTAALYFYVKEPRNSVHMFVFGFLAALSLWFREANGFIFLLPALDLVTKHKERIPMLLLGFVSGIAPRLLSAHFVYGDIFHLKDPGYSFALSHVAENLPLYAIIVMFLIPMMLYPILHFKTYHQKLLNGSIWLYLMVHLLYGYNGIEASGIKAVLLSARFLIPIIPLVIVSFTLLKNAWINRYLRLIPWIAILFISFFHVALSMIEKPNAEFTDMISSLNTDESVFIIESESAEFIELLTPLQANQPLKLVDFYQIDLQQIKASYDDCYTIRIERSDTDYRKHKSIVVKNYYDSKVLGEQINLVYRGTGLYQQFAIYKLE
jgi:hypothetical protein